MRVLAKRLPDAPFIVTGVKQTTMSGSDIARMAVTEIDSARTYKSTLPEDNGIMSRLMGVCEPSATCKTCGLRILECPTHVGHMRLGLPLILPHFEQLVWKAAGMVCCSCSALMSGKKCAACGSGAFVFKRNGTSMEVSYPDGHKLSMPYLLLRGVFAGMSEDTWTELASRLELDAKCTHPTHWVVSDVCVSPPATRPSNSTEKGFSSDDISSLLQQVVQANAALVAILPEDREDMMALWEASQTPAVQDKWQALSSAFFMLYKNKAGRPDGQRRRNGQQAAGVEETLNGKEGEIRKNSGGKRSRQSARAVLTGTSSALAMDEIGINGYMQKLTKGVRVTHWMRVQYIESLVARSVMIEIGKTKINTQFLRSKQAAIPMPEVGAIIHVPIDVGDIVLLNRQPTLGPLSFRCLKVAYVTNSIEDTKPNFDGYTLRMHLGQTPPLNADFDGDEANIHAAVDPSVEAEFYELMSAPALLLNPANGQVFGGLVQNAVAGLYLIMQQTFDRAEAMQLMLDAGAPASYQSGRGDVSGREVVSWLLPSRVSVKAGDLLVSNGRVLSGSIRKKTAGVLVHAIAKDVSTHAAVEFCTVAARVADAYLNHHALTFRFEELLDAVEQTHMDGLRKDIRGLRVRENLSPALWPLSRLSDYSPRLCGYLSAHADFAVHKKKVSGEQQCQLFPCTPGAAPRWRCAPCSR